MTPPKPKLKPLVWISSAKKDLLACPADVQQVFGYALHMAQEGGLHRQAKAMKGFGGAGVWTSLKTMTAIPFARSIR